MYHRYWEEYSKGADYMDCLYRSVCLPHCTPTQSQATQVGIGELVDVVCRGTL